MECNHSCDCCEILCSDAIKKNNESLSNQLEKIKSLESELEKAREENLRMRNCENCKHYVYSGFGNHNECERECDKYSGWEIR